MFLQLAKSGKNGVFRYIFGTILIFIAAFVVGQLPMFAVISPALSDAGMNLQDFAENMDFARIGINPNMGLALMLLSFVIGMLMLLFVVKVIHGKRIKDIITVRSSFDWSRFFFAFFLWFFLMVMVELIFFAFNPSNYVWQFNLELFIPLLLIAFLILPIQTSFEELFMRGYLMQGVSLLGGYRWIPLLVSSLVFGGLHLMNPEIEKFGLGIMVCYYVGVGLMLGIMAIMDNGLELSLGLHAVNNIYGAVCVTFAGSALNTPAIFRMTEADGTLMFFGWLLMASIFLLLVAKKYGWEDWAKLVRKIS